MYIIDFPLFSLLEEDVFFFLLEKLYSLYLVLLNVWIRAVFTTVGVSQVVLTTARIISFGISKVWEEWRPFNYTNKKKAERVLVSSK